MLAFAFFITRVGSASFPRDFTLILRLFLCLVDISHIAYFL